MDSIGRIQTIFNRCRHTLARSKWPLPVITVPQRIVRKERERIRRKAESVINTRATDSTLIISCKRKELNHYRDNVYVERPSEPIPLRFLASGGWLHYKSKGDYFTINTHSKKDHLDKSTNFTDLGIKDLLSNALRSQRLIHPSHIQVEAIPHILNLSNVICAAETGCGKTLAYLLPILQRLYTYRSVMKPAGLSSTCPRAIILLPSKELTEQVTAVAEQFCSFLDLNVLNLSGTPHLQRLIRSLRSKARDVDLLVTTPGSLNIALRSEAIIPTLVNHVVIDEADTLMDSSFNQMTVKLLRQLSAKPSGILGIQIVLASATMPRDVDVLEDTVSVDSFTHCTTQHLHHMLGHITQKFIRLCHDKKPDELVKLIQESPEASTMVFVNSCGTAKFVNELLTGNQVACALLHSNMEKEERHGKFAEFQRGESKVLVCSDLASRGLDTLSVTRVINYNFPHYISDYIHRAGRVGRIGSLSSGKVINLIGHRPEVDLVWQIERAVRSNRNIAELPNVNGNIKKQVHRKKEMRTRR